MALVFIKIQPFSISPTGIQCVVSLVPHPLRILLAGNSFVNIEEMIGTSEGQPPITSCLEQEDWLLMSDISDGQHPACLKPPHVPPDHLGGSLSIAMPPMGTLEAAGKEHNYSLANDAGIGELIPSHYHHRRCGSSNQMELPQMDLAGLPARGSTGNSESNQSSNDDVSNDSARRPRADGKASGGAGASADGGAGGSGSGGSGNDAGTQQKDIGSGSGSGGGVGGRHGSNSNRSDGSGSPLSDPKLGPSKAVVHRQKKISTGGPAPGSGQGDGGSGAGSEIDNERQGSGSGNEGVKSGGSGNNNADSNAVLGTGQKDWINGGVPPPVHHHHHHHSRRLEEKHTGSSGHAPSPAGGAASIATALLQSLPVMCGSSSNHHGTNKRQHPHEAHYARQHGMVSSPAAVQASLSSGSYAVAAAAPTPSGRGRHLSSMMGRQPVNPSAVTGLDAMMPSEPFMPLGSTAVQYAAQGAGDHFQGLVPMSAMGGALGINSGMMPWPPLAGGSGDLLMMPSHSGGGRSGGGAAAAGYSWAAAAGAPFGSDGGIEGTGQGPDLMMFDTTDMAGGDAFGFDAASDDENGSSQV